MTQRDPVARRAAERAYAEYAKKGYGLLIGYSLQDLLGELGPAVAEIVGRFCEGPGSTKETGADVRTLVLTIPADVADELDVAVGRSAWPDATAESMAAAVLCAWARRVRRDREVSGEGPGASDQDEAERS